MYPPVSKEQIEQRRRQLRQQRRVSAIKSLWRFACMSGIFAGLVWAIDRSDWQLVKPTQIQIQGNQYLSEQTIRSLLAISYPQPIMEVAPAQLTTQLIEGGSIASVKIDRSLLPPRLSIRVRDLPPVARIVPDDNTQSKILVDERGRQVPISSYQTSAIQSLPKLRLRLPERGICPNWTQIYRAIETSPVAIGVLDCRNPQNLILQTEVGKVRLGSITENKARLTHQIEQLDRLRDWRQHTDAADIDYLDLDNPDLPKLQLKQSAGSIPAKIL